MTEAECYDWCLVLAMVLRDSSLFSRSISLAVSTVAKDPVHISKLCSDVNKVRHIHRQHAAHDLALLSVMSMFAKEYTNR